MPTWPENLSDDAVLIVLATDVIAAGQEPQRILKARAASCPVAPDLQLQSAMKNILENDGSTGVRAKRRHQFPLMTGASIGNKWAADIWWSSVQ